MAGNHFHVSTFRDSRRLSPAFINMHELSLIAGGLSAGSVCLCICLSVCLSVSGALLIKSGRAFTSNRIEQQLWSVGVVPDPAKFGMVADDPRPRPGRAGPASPVAGEVRPSAEAKPHRAGTD